MQRQNFVWNMNFSSTGSSSYSFDPTISAELSTGSKVRVIEWTSQMIHECGISCGMRISTRQCCEALHSVFFPSLSWEVVISSRYHSSTVRFWWFFDFQITSSADNIPKLNMQKVDEPPYINVIADARKNYEKLQYVNTAVISGQSWLWFFWSKIIFLISKMPTVHHCPIYVLLIVLVCNHARTYNCKASYAKIENNRRHVRYLLFINFSPFDAIYWLPLRLDW